MQIVRTNSSELHVPFESPKLSDNQLAKFDVCIVCLSGVAITLLLAILYVFFKARKKIFQNHSNTFLLSLLVALLLNQTCLLLFTSVQSISSSGSALTFFRHFSTTLLIAVSSNIVSITINQYILIKYSLEYEAVFSSKRQYGLISLTWIIPICNFIFQFLFSNEKVNTGIVIFTILSSIIFILSVNTYLYFNILYHIQKIGVESTLQTDSKSLLKLKRKEKKAFRITLFIVSSYSLTFVTLPINHILMLFSIHPKEFLLFSTYLVIANTIFDACVYILMKEDVRNEFKRIILRNMRWKKSRTRIAAANTIVQTLGNSRQTSTVEPPLNPLYTVFKVPKRQLMLLGGLPIVYTGLTNGLVAKAVFILRIKTNFGFLQEPYKTFLILDSFAIEAKSSVKENPL
ncbi:melatonin receptor type 1C-like [Hydractinia symbiolongicarpus]|uniref:melatonin receptor type 1C-like n=1 Tax=Hydractinia symbiolongicarpus TaxID=13093 RepID=UPI002549F854|nr:melatonin receptor type 1C-like [Hydractinia symbiolongicarpus]